MYHILLTVNTKVYTCMSLNVNAVQGSQQFLLKLLLEMILEYNL